jgi:hypothetical protein
VDLGVDLAVARARDELLQAVSGSLVARPAALVACLHAIFVDRIAMVVRVLLRGRSLDGPGEGGQAHGADTKRAQ